MADVTQSDLTPNEKQVLLVMGDLETADPKELSATSGISLEAAVQSAFLLEENGLLQISEFTTEKYNLTKEGKEYVNSGLPERQVIEKVTSSTPIGDLKSEFGQKLVGIALGWLRKKGWARIEDGNLIPGDIPGPGDDEEALAGLEAGTLTAISKEVKNKLVKRNLIEISEDKTRTIMITEPGKELFRSGIIIEEDIAQLTSDHIRTGSWKEKHLRPYNIYAPVQPVYGTKTHPYQRLIDEMRQIFLEMGFTEIKGEIIQSSFWNFDALFQPQDHPARDMQDTFYLDSTGDVPPEYTDYVAAMHEHGGDIDSKGWGGKWSQEQAKKNVLRTHTTANTIKYLINS